MEMLIKALAPAFATGFAVQQFLEILDPLIEKIIWASGKKLILGIVSLIMGLMLAIGAGLRVLNPLGVSNADTWDIIVTGLVISAGTEGFNSIMKFLGYSKDRQKGEAAERLRTTGS